MTKRRSARFGGALLMSMAAAVLCCPGGAFAAEVDEILKATGVQGGLVVHVDCGDGKLTAALGTSERFLVHGLGATQKDVSAAREHIRKAGLYGRVSVELWPGGPLPYNDNQVNLLIADASAVSQKEIDRVLCPGGAAYLTGATVKTYTKPRPADIDEWTHYLHGPDNNAVAADAQITTPKHLQWEAEPKRTRDHDAQASFSAMTSSHGRIFYIFDFGPTSMIHRPAQWRLIARDAFNGKQLWQRDIPSWSTHLRYFRSGPVQLPRRLVSVGDRVYVTLGVDAPITMLDAATGETLQTYAGTKNTEEFIVADGVVLTVIGDPHVMDRYAPKADNYWEWAADEKPESGKTIVAIEASTGKELWRKKGANLAWYAPLTLIAGGGKAYYLDNANLFCVDLKTGKQQWTAPFATKGLFLRNYSPTVVHHDDVVLCLSTDRLSAFATGDGRKLWETKGYLGFASPGDLFVIDGLVWTFPGLATVKMKASDVPGGGKEFLAFDLHTGEVKKRLSKGAVWPGGHHHRCYRNKATERFLISSRRGTEFVDLKGTDNVINWWIRGVCQYGVMPCNGLLYLPPHPCQCFNTYKFDGFHALSGANSLDGLKANDADRLVKGPAYASAGAKKRPAAPPEAAPSGKRSWQPPVPIANPDEWPTYRHDASRSGAATCSLPADLGKAWEVDLDAKLSAAVVAENRLFIAATEKQTLHCLDAANGRGVWQFVAGGRIDSPPTVHDGLAVFGCRDGHVYAVSVADGRLAWRFRVGPVDRRIVVRDRLESVWPVHGSVLIQNGTVYAAGGHTSYLDGGIRLVALDARTGKMLHQATVSTPGASQAGCLPDVLVSDGQSISMRQKQFDASLAEQKGARGIVTTTGLLEDLWMHRLNWALGGAKAPSLSSNTPAGKLIVFDAETAVAAQTYYTFLKRTKSMQPATHTGHLHQKYVRYKPGDFPIGNRLTASANRAPAAAASRRGKTNKKDKKTKPPVPAEEPPDKRSWNVKLPLQVRAMLLAGERIVVAGWEDFVGVQGADGGEGDVFLWTVSTADGRKLSAQRLEARPVFDGMAAAYGRLYVPLRNGKILCLGSPGGKTAGR